MSQGNRPGEFDSGRPAAKGDTLGVLGIVFGAIGCVAGLVFCCPLVSGVGLLLGITGLICAMKGRPEKKTIGLVLSGIAIAISLGTTAYGTYMYVKLANDPKVREQFDKAMKDAQDRQKQGQQPQK